MFLQKGEPTFPETGCGAGEGREGAGSRFLREGGKAVAEKGGIGGGRGIETGFKLEDGDEIEAQNRGGR